MMFERTQHQNFFAWCAWDWNRFTPKFCK